MSTELTDPKLRRILVSPYKMDILDHLAKSKNPLSTKELQVKMITKPTNLQDFLNYLKDEDVIFVSSNEYGLTSKGREFYNILKKIITEAF